MSLWFIFGVSCMVYCWGDSSTLLLHFFFIQFIFQFLLAVAVRKVIQYSMHTYTHIADFQSERVCVCAFSILFAFSLELRVVVLVCEFVFVHTFSLTERWYFDWLFAYYDTVNHNQVMVIFCLHSYVCVCVCVSLSSLVPCVRLFFLFICIDAHIVWSINNVDTI